MAAIIQSGQTIWTFQDAMEYVLDSFDIDRTGLNERRARNAVRYAYNQIAQRHDWTYYNRQRLLQTVAPYDTGTVVYDHTGGASERLLTLSGGTFPSWATFGRVIIDSVHYEVEDLKSSTTLTLAETSNPGEDVASTTYEIYRSSYPLPVNFKRFLDRGLWDVSQQLPIRFVDSNQYQQASQVFYTTPSTPWTATILSTGKYLGGREIVFGPPPSAATTYDMVFEALPRPLTIDEYSAVTVSVSSGATTVTGATGVTFPLNCAGAVMRFASGSVKPTGLQGGLESGDNPYVEQHTIKSRTSGTVVELEDAVGQAFSAVGYTISDPIDIHCGVMLTAFLRACESEFSRLASREDYKIKAAAAQQALWEAMENDSPVSNARGAVTYDEWARTTSTDEG